MNEEVYYQNVDVLLMDPCYSREYGDDEDFELYCSDLVIDTYVDGYYHVIKGAFEDNIDVIADNLEQYSIGEFTLDTARIGIYDYHKAIEEQPKLKERIEGGEIVAVIIKNFSGNITSIFKDSIVYVLGKSDDGEHDFFTVELS